MSADATPILTEGRKHCPVTGSPCHCRGSYCRMTGHHLEAADFRTTGTTPTLPDAMNAEWERLQADSRELARLRYGLTELERALLALTREAHEVADKTDGVLALLRRVAGAGE
jgi:hypothetical protein